jgi:hypothetical protein
METAEFLTPEECAEVDKALLTSHDKFAARVAIYALRSLKQIAQQTGIPVSDLTPGQIEDWIYQDPSLQAGMDVSFKAFFSRLVTASRQPLQQAAQSAAVPVESLTLAQVIAWFEQDARQRLSQQAKQ